jgi:NhaP-type Na+/H+ or K+/H+ antiporter
MPRRLLAVLQSEGLFNDATALVVFRRSALTLVLPFAVYVAADEIGASGVVAVVVLALQLRSASGADEAAERLVQRSFWGVVERWSPAWRSA